MKQTYQYYEENLALSEPSAFEDEELKENETLINFGPQHPSTHGVLRLEVKLEGEIVKKIVPHIGFLHRCFEKHAETLPFNQTLPFTDRLDYVAAMNNELAFAMGVEKMLGIEEKIPARVHYIRILVAELNRIASHFVALGTYGMDIGAFTPFLWLMRDRETILKMLEWASGARMLYNYIWIGGLYYDLPLGFENKCLEFCQYIIPKLKDVDELLIHNKIFINRTAHIGVLDKNLAINYGVSGPILRASGLRYDLRKVDSYSLYDTLDFEIPVGRGEMGTLGDCWDRTWVRLQECYESLKIIAQTAKILLGKHKRTRDFNPRALLPKKIRPQKQQMYVRAENPKGELGFHFFTDGKTDIPLRCKCRGPSFSNLSVLPEIGTQVMIADLFAILGSLDVIMGEVDR